nr:response regulator transcription factor [Paracoccus fontiphilus]
MPRQSADQVREILIVDDHPLMCDALALTLKISFGLKNVRTARSLGAALDGIRAQGAPDAVILDLNLPDARGAEGIVTLRRQLPDVPITMISADMDGAMISAAMAAGAQGYISKSLGREALVDSLRRMWEGEHVTPEGYAPDQACAEDEAKAELARRFATLTPQQMKILRLICQGKANKEISYDLSIAEATVKTHITAIMSKINARRRTQAVLLANTVRLFEAG